MKRSQVRNLFLLGVVFHISQSYTTLIFRPIHHSIRPATIRTIKTTQTDPTRTRDVSVVMTTLSSGQDESSSLSSSSSSDVSTRSRRLSVGAILAASFLNLLGFTMAGPITPALGNHFGLSVGASFGSLTSAYPLGMLLGLFLWPSLSDRIGRKPVMAISLFGSGLGLALQSLVIQNNGSLSLFLAMRVLTGSFAGSSPISKAFLADVGYKDGKLPRYLALKDASATGAFIVGPALGGIMYDIRRRSSALKMATATATTALTRSEILQTTGSLSFVIGVSAAASILASLLIGIFVKEIKTVKKEKSLTTEDNLLQEDEELIPCPLGIQPLRLIHDNAY